MYIVLCKNLSVDMFKIDSIAILPEIKVRLLQSKIDNLDFDVANYEFSFYRLKDTPHEQYFGNFPKYLFRKNKIEALEWLDD